MLGDARTPHPETLRADPAFCVLLDVLWPGTWPEASDEQGRAGQGLTWLCGCWVWEKD